jgi:hypothetical protein
MPVDSLTLPQDTALSPPNTTMADGIPAGAHILAQNGPKFAWHPAWTFSRSCELRMTFSLR